MLNAAWQEIQRRRVDCAWKLWSKHEYLIQRGTPLCSSHLRQLANYSPKEGCKLYRVGDGQATKKPDESVT